MSDKMLLVTLTGLYEGYEVMVSVEAPLTQLGKLVERLREYGVQPVHQAPGAVAPPASAGKRPLDTLEGTLNGHITGENSRQPAARVAVLTEQGERWGDFWKDFPGDLVILPKGTRVRFYGHSCTIANTFGREHHKFIVSRWEAVE